MNKVRHIIFILANFCWIMAAITTQKTDIAVVSVCIGVLCAILTGLAYYHAHQTKKTVREFSEELTMEVERREFNGEPLINEERETTPSGNPNIPYLTNFFLTKVHKVKTVELIIPKPIKFSKYREQKALEADSFKVHDGDVVGWQIGGNPETPFPHEMVCVCRIGSCLLNCGWGSDQRDCPHHLRMLNE